MDSHLIFFSKNNYVLGEKLRSSLRKFNLEVMYCNNLCNLISQVSDHKKYIVFFDKAYNNYAKLLNQLSETDIWPIVNLRFVFIDDDLRFYAEMHSSDRFFIIPEINLESALYNIVTKCQILNYAQDNQQLSKFNYGEIVSEELIKLGFSFKLVGFRYIKQCMEQAIKNNFILGSLHKEVYPYVGIQNSTSPINIERGIRTAILNASKQECFKLDGVSADHHVSNRYFLEYLLDKLRSYKPQ